MKSKIDWHKEKGGVTDYVGVKGNVFFCIDKYNGGFAVRIAGFGNSLERFGHEKPFKTLEAAKRCCVTQLNKYIKSLESKIESLK